MRKEGEGDKEEGKEGSRKVMLTLEALLVKSYALYSESCRDKLHITTLHEKRDS